MPEALADGVDFQSPATHLLSNARIKENSLSREGKHI
jgi:hypothetical protein